MIESGSQAFLQQAHRNNWQRYLASLATPDARRLDTRSPQAGGWDLCILTASDRRQAAMVQAQLDRRRADGLLPYQTRFRVIADPEGRRIGSGGATLRILAALYGDPTTAPSLPADLAALAELPANRLHILVIHSGGDSRRLPHCSATGKLFARIPRVLPDGRASTIFDELLINLSGVAAGSPPGILLVSGDVLLVFDHLQLAFQRHGVTGVAVAAPAEMGQRHGVYVSQPGQKPVHAFLHKATAAALDAWRAVDDRGQVAIDTGLVWLDPPTAQRWARLLTAEPVAALCHWETTPDAPADLPLNLYGDLLLPLAPSTQEADYMADASEGAPTPSLLAARRVIWPALRNVPFSVERLEPAVFVHFGSTEEYWRMVAADLQLAHLCGWTQHAAAWLGAAIGAHSPVLINAVLGRAAAGQAARAALIADSRLAELTWDGRAIVAGAETDTPIRLGHDLTLHQLPAPGGTITRLFGMADDPKRHWTDATATYLNQPWAAWLAAAQVEPALLWPHVPPAARNLWNARLFPLLPERDESLRLALALQDPAQAGAIWRAQWAASPRLSLAEGFAQADGQQILVEIAALEDEVITRRALVYLEREQPATELAALLHSHTPATLARRGQRVAARLATADHLLQWRGYRALAAAVGEPEWEERAFALLAQQIEATVTQRQPVNVASAAAPLPVGSVVRVETAARIDFGGGWTDTPPYSLERGGTVLNAAILLDGSYPIVVEGAWLPEPRILLESLDIGEALEPVTAGEIHACANPADPFALLKAALLLKGIVPADCPASTPVGAALARWPGGLRLRTQTTIPRGSGLGTSSILAGAVLACLDRLLGLPPNQARLFDEVLWLEQLLTTGGGWQDQAGGLVGGIKLVTTAPGLHQALAVEPLATTAAAGQELYGRLLLVYTGQQRLAKNLLRAVMSRWMLRDPEMVWLLGEIGRLAVSMRDALAAGDVDSFGEMVAAHWELNKRMDPGCTNPFIDALFAFMHPYIRGAKLAGAGGGGFAIVVADRAPAAQELGAALAAHYAGTPVRVWPHAIPAEGLRVT